MAGSSDDVCLYVAWQSCISVGFCGVSVNWRCPWCWCYCLLHTSTRYIQPFTIHSCLTQRLQIFLLGPTFFVLFISDQLIKVSELIMHARVLTLSEGKWGHKSQAGFSLSLSPSATWGVWVAHCCEIHQVTLPKNIFRGMLTMFERAINYWKHLLKSELHLLGIPSSFPSRFY